MRRKRKGVKQACVPSERWPGIGILRKTDLPEGPRLTMSGNGTSWHYGSSRTLDPSPPTTFERSVWLFPCPSWGCCLTWSRSGIYKAAEPGLEPRTAWLQWLLSVSVIPPGVFFIWNIDCPHSLPSQSFKIQGQRPQENFHECSLVNPCSSAV